MDDVLQFLTSEKSPLQGQLFERDAEPLLPPDQDADEATRREIIGLLSANAVDIDDLIREAQCQPEAVMAVLLELEVAGRVTRSAGGMVALSKR